MEKFSGLIVVLGMHRSGTSCCVQMLHAAGAWCGDTRTGRKRRKNGRGVWEDPVVRSFNNALLSANDVDWQISEPGLANVKQIEPPNELLEPYFSSETTVLKDPRMLPLWQYWEPVLKECRFLPVFRHPLAVAKSLQTRNDIDTQKSLAIWEHYNRKLIGICRQYQLNTIEFGQPDFTEQMQSWIVGHTSLDHHKALQGFSSAHLRSEANDRAPLPDAVNRLYQELISIRANA